MASHLESTPGYLHAPVALAAPDQFRSSSSLKLEEHSGPSLGLIFLRFAKVPFTAGLARLEKTERLCCLNPRLFVFGMAGFRAGLSTLAKYAFRLAAVNCTTGLPEAT